MDFPNIFYIDEISIGCNDFRNDLIKIVKEELPIEIDLYRHYLGEKNYLLAANLVHKIKHKICVFGMKESYFIAQLFEEELKMGKINLQKEFECILNLIQGFVNKL